ncbi:MAG: 16S rRNA (guanine(527)-N(7))-methyltransferase RsmG [Pseudomonadota bacterium]|nr:16S rRNA (guanine(527)-N(7))-methyltransferase RsmG [Pseudomonadota bacterium]
MNATTLPPGLRDTLRSGLASLDLAPDLATPLLDYLALLMRWNRTYNLTAVRDPDEMIRKHLLDSLAMHPFVDDIVASGGCLADLGTGAGLPGIPLAIAKPGLRVTLVESAGKKARFMREAVRQLGLADVRVSESRMEALDEPGQYDAITARALATLPLIVELGGHLLRPGGRLLAMKGTLPADEIAALPEGWAAHATHVLAVPGLQAERHLVIVGRAPGGPGRA